MPNPNPKFIRDVRIERTTLHTVPPPEDGDAPAATRELLQQAGAQLKSLALSLRAGARGIDIVGTRIKELSDTIERAGLQALRVEQEVAHMRHHAYHDALTQLPNRALLFDRLGRAMALATRQDRQLALLLLDLDEFKDVNDRFGHAVGDRLLRCVADRLTQATRNSDTASRYGGDEFVVILPDLDSAEGAQAAARKIHKGLAEPFRINGHSITVTASIGVAVFPQDAATIRALLRHADLAMYRSKHRPNWGDRR